MELAGTVFIDGANAAARIKAMARWSTQSRCGNASFIAPEGTRTFRRNWDHLKRDLSIWAIQGRCAGCYRLISQCRDVARKMISDASAKVRVDVLPAVDTSRMVDRTMTEQCAGCAACSFEVWGRRRRRCARKALVNEERTPAKKTSAAKRTRKPAHCGETTGSKKTVGAEETAISQSRGQKKMVSKKFRCKAAGNRSTRKAKRSRKIDNDRSGE